VFEGAPPDVTRLEDLAEHADLTPDELRDYLWAEIERRQQARRLAPQFVGPDGKLRPVALS
jgi:hypothetical protein